MDDVNRVSDIPLNQIHLDETQPKCIDMKVPEYKLKIQLLVKDIQARGLVEPITVVPFVTRDGELILGKKALKYSNHTFWLCNGHKRTLAYRMMGKKTIPAMIREESVLRAVKEIQLLTSAKHVSLDLALDGVTCGRMLQEYIKMYITDYPGKTIEDALDYLGKLTGYSQTFFEGRLRCLEVPKALQKQIEDGVVGNNVPIEIAHSIKKEEDRQEVYKATMAGKIIGTLDYRQIGRRISRIECLPLPEDEKIALKKVVIQRSGRDPEVTLDGKADFDGYIAQASDWYAQVSQWSLVGLNKKQLDKLAGTLTDLASLFRNMQKDYLHVSNLKKAKWNRRG